MKNKEIAIGWLFFLFGLVVATEGFEPRLTYETFKWWEKLQVIFVFGLTMYVGYKAGKES